MLLANNCKRIYFVVYKLYKEIIRCTWLNFFYVLQGSILHIVRCFASTTKTYERRVLAICLQLLQK